MIKVSIQTLVKQVQSVVSETDESASHKNHMRMQVLKISTNQVSAENKKPIVFRFKTIPNLKIVGWRLDGEVQVVAPENVSSNTKKNYAYTQTSAIWASQTSEKRMKEQYMYIESNLKKTNLLIDTLTVEALTVDLRETEVENADEIDQDWLFDMFFPLAS